MLDQRKRLGIVHDDDVVLQVHAQRVLEEDLLVRSPLLLSDIDNTALQAVVKFLGKGKELRATLDDAPAGLDADCVHQQSERERISATPPPYCVELTLTIVKSWSFAALPRMRSTTSAPTSGLYSSIECRPRVGVDT